MNPTPLSLRDPTADTTFSYETSPTLYLFTSLTAGSSHILTATSRLETILKANRIPFQAVDCATDEKARRIWGRRAGKRKLPGLVREGVVVADLEQVEGWNEFGEIGENLGGGAKGGVGGGQQQGQQQAQQQATIATKAGGASAQPSAATAATAASTTPSLVSDGKEVSTAPESKTSAQALQQKQQSALASEAALAAKSRGKPQPQTKPTSTASTTTPTTSSAAPSNDGTLETPSTPPSSTADPSTAAPASPSANTPRAAEEEAAEAFSNDDQHTKHNMSANAGLPPLSLRTKSTSPTASAKSEGRDRGESIAYPSAPQPTAVEPGEKVCPPEPVVASEEEKESEGLQSKVVEEGAAPAGKSGLDAVSSDSSTMAASMGGKGNMVGTVEASTKREHRSSSIAEAGEGEVKAVESRDSIPEMAAEEVEDGDEPDRGEGLGNEGHAQKVKFEEDQKKGDPTDTSKAEESLQD